MRQHKPYVKIRVLLKFFLVTNSVILITSLLTLPSNASATPSKQVLLSPVGNKYVTKEFTTGSIQTSISNNESQTLSLDSGQVTNLIVKYSSETENQKLASFETSKSILENSGIKDPTAPEEIGFGYSVVDLGENISITEANQIIDKLENLPNVINAEIDTVVTLETVQSSPEWGIDRIDQRSLPLDNRYEYISDGTGVKIYVVDTGINSLHTEFTSRIPYGLYATGFTSFEDCNGHGTHVSGTAAGTTYGVAKNATIIPVRVFGCSSTTSLSTLISGLEAVVADHLAGEPAVLNMSLGTSGSDSLDAAVQAVINDGITVVVSSGNSTSNSCLTSPARVTGAITVNSSNELDASSSFSNFGSCSDIYAPGESIRSAWYTSTSASAISSGTSMASPHVAGVAARILQRTPTMTPSQVWDAINSLATPLIFAPGDGDPDKLLFASSDYPVANSIIWNINGGESVTPGPTTFTSGMSIGSLPGSPTRNGYTFDGWYIDSAFAGTAIDGTYTPSSPYGAITFYAKWNLIPVVDSPALVSANNVVPVVVVVAQVDTYDLAARTLGTKKMFSAKSLASQVGVKVVSNKATVSITVSKASKKFCTVSGSTLTTLKPGNCVATFITQEPKPKGGKMPKKTRTVKTFVVQ